MPKCPECKKEATFNTAAKTCIHCGAVWREPPETQKIATFLVIGLATIAWLFWPQKTEPLISSDQNVRDFYSYESPALSAGERNILSAGEEEIKRILKDPYSAHFRNVAAHGICVTGEVNAKNSFGAYNGYQLFVAIPNVRALLDDGTPAFKKNAEQVLMTCTKEIK